MHLLQNLLQYREFAFRRLFRRSDMQCIPCDNNKRNLNKITINMENLDDKVKDIRFFNPRLDSAQRLFLLVRRGCVWLVRRLSGGVFVLDQLGNL